ncbi:MAG: hypothetical protein K0S32_1883 [Bacteroidetes bacterium]|jgi:hypothetical protein|nr:hypothetical protein [Bacteroidota bacterium]
MIYNEFIVYLHPESKTTSPIICRHEALKQGNFSFNV